MTEDRVVRAHGMPILAPSFPGNGRFPPPPSLALLIELTLPSHLGKPSTMNNREYFFISYQTNGDALRYANLIYPF